MPSPALRHRGWILALAAVLLADAFWLRTGNLLNLHGAAVRLGGETLRGPTPLTAALTIAGTAVVATAGILVGQLTPALEADVFGALELGLFAAWLAIWPLRSPWSGPVPVRLAVTQFALALECTRLARGPLGLDAPTAAAVGWLGGTAWLGYRLPAAILARPALPPDLGIALTASGPAMQAAAFVTVVAVITLGYLAWSRLWPQTEARPAPRSRLLQRAAGSAIPAVIGLGLLARTVPVLSAFAWLTLPQLVALAAEAVAVASVGGAVGWLFAGVVWPEGPLPRAYRWVAVALIAGWMLAANPFLVGHADRVAYAYMVYFSSSRWVQALPATFAAGALARWVGGLSLPASLSLSLLAGWGAETLTAWYGLVFSAAGPSAYAPVPRSETVPVALGAGLVVALAFLIAGRRRKPSGS